MVTSDAVRYRALNRAGVAAVLAGLMAPVLLLVVGTGVVLLLTDSALGVVGAVLCLLLVVGGIAVVLVSTRLQFTIDDEGMTLLHYFRSHRIRWEEVAVIEQSSAYWTDGAVVVMPRNSAARPLTALATTDRLGLWRREVRAMLAATPDSLRPPTQAAIAAHQRWLARTMR